MKVKKSKSKNIFGKSSGALSKNRLKIGDIGPDFSGTKRDMNPFEFYNEAKNKLKIIQAIASIDTSAGSSHTIRLNEIASTISNDIFVVTVSADLPFAIDRFCSAQGIKNCFMVSDYMNMNFGNGYGFALKETRLLSGGLLVLDRKNEVIFIEYLKNPDMNPDYEHAVAATERILYDETLLEVDKLLYE